MPCSGGSSQHRDGTCVLCLLPWQVGSLPLAPPGESLPKLLSLKNKIIDSTYLKGISEDEIIYFWQNIWNSPQSWVFIGRTDAEAETPVLWPPHVKCWLIGKEPDASRDWGQEEKGPTEDEMAGWHHWLDAYESERTPGVGDGQGGLACCDSWGRRVGHDWATELNWTGK